MNTKKQPDGSAFAGNMIQVQDLEMSKPRYRKNDDNTRSLIPDGVTRLPTDRHIAVYYRQSNLAQVGNISTMIQTVDMVEVLKQRGWPADDIILIDMDEGISGSTKIDERPGMRKLFDLITQGLVGAVACQDEDRLFRDVTQIQVNVFIEACRAAGVLVITPFMIYDFANPQTGTYHARQFRFKSEMAAEYVNAYIRGRLHRAKDRLLMEGKWAGPPIPPGFMIDMRKTLPDGMPNPGWRRLISFEPYAEVINEYFRLFLHYGGNASATFRHIRDQGPHYPDPETHLPPEGFQVIYRIKRLKSGYHPTRNALIGILTHAAYIGHWIVRGQIVLWNNHPGIVPEDVFMKAFNYLSDVALDGSPNPDYRPIWAAARPSLDAKRPVERPLYAGMLYSEFDGEWRKVGTNWVSPLQHYAYTFWAPVYVDMYLWSKAAMFVDAEVTHLLLEKLRATFDPEVWSETLDSFAKQSGESRKRTLAQIQHLERVMESQIASLDTLTHPMMIRAVQERYEQAESEHARLTRELDSVDREAHELEAIKALKETCGPALENWDNLTYEEKRVVASAFIERIEATPVEKHGLQLVILWKDGSTDQVVLPRQSTTGTQWLPSEVETLIDLIDAEASQVEIAATFPRRTWDMIRNKIYSLVGPGRYHFEVTPMRGFETYAMFLERTDGNRQPYQASSGDRWKGPELERLNDMLDRQATKLELLEAFPHRTWGRIRAKVTELRGEAFEIPGPKPMRRDETYPQYTARTEAASRKDIG